MRGSALQKVTEQPHVACCSGVLGIGCVGAWVLRGGRVTTALIGSSKSEQILDCVGAIGNLNFTEDELSEIDRLSGDQDINLWAASSETN